MLKPNEKQITEAPKYSIDENGVIKNIQTQALVTSVAGSSRLTLEDGSRKSFKVSALKNQYFPQDKVEDKKSKKETPPAPGNKVVKSLKTKSDSPKTAKEKKVVDNGGKKDKAFFDKVRADFDADPKAFDIMKYSKSVGVSYGRIWSCIKLHQAKLKAKKNAK